MATEKDQAFWDRVDVAWQAAWNEGKLDALDEFWPADFVYHQPPFPDVVGLEAYKKFIADARASHPDLHLSYDGGIRRGEGDWSAVWGSFHGTFMGTGVSPLTGETGAGQKMDYVWCTRTRWVGTRIAEDWVYRDHVTMLRQRGYTFVPPEPQK